MTKTTKKALAAGALGLGLVLSGTGAVSAATTTASTTASSTATTTVRMGRFSGIIAALVQKFNLKQSEVEQVFNTYYPNRKDDDRREDKRVETEAKVKAKIDERLVKGLKEGKLTQAQVDLIKAKMISVQAEIKALDGKTPEEFKTGVKKIMDSLKKWAKDNHIPDQYLSQGFGPGNGKGMHLGVGFKGMMKGFSK